MDLLVHFVPGGNRAGRLVRWWTDSDVGHVAVTLCGERWEAIPGKGVVVSGGGSRPGEHTVPFTVNGWDMAPVRAWLTDEELGARYDWWGALSAGVPCLRRRHPDAWFCSELAAEILIRARVLPAGIIPHSLTPQALRDLCAVAASRTAA